jgi:hypothetical protein
MEPEGSLPCSQEPSTGPILRQNERQNHGIKIANICFENVAKFGYLGTTITNQNFIQEEIKRRMNSDNACYHSVQNLFSSHLLSKNINIRIYKTSFSCGSVCVQNLVSDIKGGTQTEGV